MNYANAYISTLHDATAGVYYIVIVNHSASLASITVSGTTGFTTGTLTNLRRASSRTSDQLCPLRDSTTRSGNGRLSDAARHKSQKMSAASPAVRVTIGAVGANSVVPDYGIQVRKPQHNLLKVRISQQSRIESHALEIRVPAIRPGEVACARSVPAQSEPIKRAPLWSAPSRYSDRMSVPSRSQPRKLTPNSPLRARSLQASSPPLMA